MWRRHSRRAVVASQAPRRSGSLIRSRFSTSRNQVVWVTSAASAGDSRCARVVAQTSPAKRWTIALPGRLVPIVRGAHQGFQTWRGGDYLRLLSDAQVRKRYAGRPRQGRVGDGSRPRCLPSRLSAGFRHPRGEVGPVASANEAGDRRRHLRGGERCSVPPRPPAEVLDIGKRLPLDRPIPAHEGRVDVLAHGCSSRTNPPSSRTTHERFRDGWSTRRRSRPGSAAGQKRRRDCSLPAGATTATRPSCGACLWRSSAMTAANGSDG